ncbi:MAG TPA: hypothetical protein VF101_04320 [Gaiellaceae bacterium]
MGTDLVAECVKRLLVADKRSGAADEDSDEVGLPEAHAFVLKCSDQVG